MPDAMTCLAKARPLLTIELTCACLDADGAELLLALLLLLVVVVVATGCAVVVVATAVVAFGACGSFSVFALFAANAV